jgi:hypothetical protein
MNWTLAKDILGAVGTAASLASLGYKCASSLFKKNPSCDACTPRFGNGTTTLLKKV